MPHSTLISLSLTLLLMLSSAFIIIKAHKTKHSSQIRSQLNGIDYLIMLGLSTLYIIISAYNFGSFNQDQGMWNGGIRGKSLELTFTKPTTIRTIAFYTALSNGDFKISASTKESTNFTLLDFNYNKKRPRLFTWNIYNTPTPISVNKIRFETTRPLAQIKKIAILDSSGKNLTNFSLRANLTTVNDNLVDLLTGSQTPTKYSYQIWQTGASGDETFYATSAYQLLYNTFPFVTVHPPLAMLIIELGIILLGMNPIGWRIFALLFGALLIPLMYIFAKQLFKQRKIAVISAILISAECMHFTLSRMASLEPFVTFFIMATYWFLYNYYLSYTKFKTQQSSLYYLLGLGFSFALAISCKWSALYSAPIILCVLIYCEFYCNWLNWSNLLKRIPYYLICLVIIPLIIYIFSYIPFANIMKAHNLLAFVLERQIEIFNFHTKVKLYYTGQESAWWSWPLLLKPFVIYKYVNWHTLQSTTTAIIGNPAICWTGILAVLALIVLGLKHQDKKAAYLLIIIAAQYLPFSLLNRPMYIYYFYSAIPGLILAICYVLNYLLKRQEKSLHILVYLYVLLVVAVFILFFSVISNITCSYIYMYKYINWYSSWKF